MSVRNHRGLAALAAAGWVWLAAASTSAAPPQALAGIAVDVADPAAVKLSSVGDRTVVIVPGESSRAAAADGATKKDEQIPAAAWHGVDPGMDPATARVVWTSAVACPEPGVAADLTATATSVLCRTAHDVYAISAQDGSVRWKFHHKKRLALLAAAGERVAVNIDNEELAVLELASGRVLRRFALGGAPLQGIAQSPDGPVALLVARGAGQTAPGKSHSILAQPLAEAASTTDARLEPLRPLWQVPFGAADYRLIASQGTIIATPVPGVLDARDAATGAVLWADPVPFLPTLEPLGDALAAGGIRPDGVRWIGLMEPRTRTLRWRRTWPFGALKGVGLDNGHVIWLGERGWLVTAARDGSLEAEATLQDGEDVVSVQAAEHTLTIWLAQGKAMSWQQVALHPREPATALPPAPALDWLRAGRQLAVLHYRHGGRDAQTALPGDGPMDAWIVWPEPAADGLRLTLRAQDGRGGVTTATRTLDAAALARATRLDLDLPGAEATWTDRTALLVSRAVWQALDTSGRAELSVQGQPVSLHVEGQGAVRLQVRDKPGPLRWADVDARIVASEDGKIRLWLMPLGEPPAGENAAAALVARAELPERTWALMNVDLRPPATPATAAAQKTGQKTSTKAAAHKRQRPGGRGHK